MQINDGRDGQKLSSQDVNLAEPDFPMAFSQSDALRETQMINGDLSASGSEAAAMFASGNSEDRRTARTKAAHRSAGLFGSLLVVLNRVQFETRSTNLPRSPRGDEDLNWNLRVSNWTRFSCCNRDFHSLSTGQRMGRSYTSSAESSRPDLFQPDRG
jgi:hypothetical protein